MKALTSAQVESYRHDGFLFPFPALGEQERATCLANLEHYESWLGTTVPQADLKWRTQPHACCRGTPISCAIRASSTSSRT
jgi:non-heme Fe2+,alpha-ketoglutarate-dependent halogenase